ncbi:MAG TPA: sigma 54-interacting transcriptional regulator [Thermoanaerobaculia bacterium]|nr:sigma 54-interacting transcriptional regulator [Thermoanaerobaculia bacterium]
MPTNPRDARAVEPLVGVLTEIARTVTETLSLPDAFARVAGAARRVLPFDAAGVVRLVDGPALLSWGLSAPDGAEAGRRYGRDDVSPLLWPGAASPRRIDEAAVALDATRQADRELLDAGMRSMLVATIVRGDVPIGDLWFASRAPRGFGPADEPTAQAIADILSATLEHERLAEEERRRIRRHRELDSLASALARALDVREVFDQVSAIAREVLPHERMTLGLLSEDRTENRMWAVSGDRDWVPDSYPIPESERAQMVADYQIVGDAEADLPADSSRRAILLAAGLRSSLRVPIRLEGKTVGALSFHARETQSFREEDVDLALRVADQVALAFSHQRLAEEARRAEEARQEAARLEVRVRALADELESRDGFGRVVGASPAWRSVLVQASKVAPTETTVLLTGESGTGKEVVARAVHRASARSSGPFVALNCAALPEQLLESELFGHEKGAFTGAYASRAGRLEQAAGGTLFLDEAGETSPLVQAKLLRVLEAREFQRLGGAKVLKAEVRIVAATNRDLHAAMARGDFREDLFYRLSVFEIHLPPLRERPEDVLLLTERFLEDLSRNVGRPAPGVSREARELLLAYSWPGNVRELRNALERAVILSEGGLVQAEHLPIAVARSGEARVASASAIELPPGGLDLDALEKTLVTQALEKARNNRSRAAKLLGLTRAQLYTRLERYGLA